jgi:lipopolysaccharide/colanic/teichoic acid biosynthesis glycosyltransferase
MIDRNAGSKGRGAEEGAASIHNSTQLDDLESLIPACERNRRGCFGSCLQSAPASTWATSRARRACDVAIALLILALCFIPMLVIGLLVRCTSPGPALFRQKRVGRGGRLFCVVKFRSMTERHNGPGLCPEGDVRITPLGRILRKFKLDELPQFYNVLKGDMSIVGPRPKLPQFAAIPNMPYRPGITGLATLAFRSEERMLGSVVAERVESFYEEHIKPLKANLDVCYMCEASPSSDLRIVLTTFIACVFPADVPRMLGSIPDRPRRLDPDRVPSEGHSRD